MEDDQADDKKCAGDVQRLENPLHWTMLEEGRLPLWPPCPLVQFGRITVLEVSLGFIGGLALLRKTAATTFIVPELVCKHMYILFF